MSMANSYFLSDAGITMCDYNGATISFIYVVKDQTSPGSCASGPNLWSQV